MAKAGIFTAMGRVLIRITEQPGITINELTEDLFLTKRTIWELIGELRSMGYLTIRKEGRRHHYYVSAFGSSELKELVSNTSTVNTCGEQ